VPCSLTDGPPFIGIHPHPNLTHIPPHPHSLRASSQISCTHILPTIQTSQYVAGISQRPYTHPLSSCLVGFGLFALYHSLSAFSIGRLVGWLPPGRPSLTPHIDIHTSLCSIFCVPISQSLRYLLCGRLYGMLIALSHSQCSYLAIHIPRSLSYGRSFLFSSIVYVLGRPKLGGRDLQDRRSVNVFC